MSKNKDVCWFEKACTRCGEVKPLSQFHRAKKAYDGRKWYCAKCWSAEQKSRKEKDRSKRQAYERRRLLRRYYNLTPEDYHALLEKQDSKCAICGSTSSEGTNGTNRKLCIDHNHQTGELRGLLCNRCNRAIGLLGDNVTLLHRAIEYLNGAPKDLYIQENET